MQQREQRISGMRVWIWAVSGLFILGLVVMSVVMAGEGFTLTAFNPRLVLMALFFLALGIGFVAFVRGKKEERQDLP